MSWRHAALAPAELCCPSADTAAPVLVCSDHPRPVRLRFTTPLRDGSSAMDRINTLAERGRFDDALKLVEEVGLPLSACPCLCLLRIAGFQALDIRSPL